VEAKRDDEERDDWKINSGVWMELGGIKKEDFFQSLVKVVSARGFLGNETSAMF